MWHDIGAFLGLNDASGVSYLFWSGFFADLALFGGALLFIRRHQCHVRGCWRFGAHPIAGGTITVCYKHHPGLPDKITSEVVRDMHEEHLRREADRQH